MKNVFQYCHFPGLIVVLTEHFANWRIFILAFIGLATISVFVGSHFVSEAKYDWTIGCLCEKQCLCLHMGKTSKDSSDPNCAPRVRVLRRLRWFECGTCPTHGKTVNRLILFIISYDLNFYQLCPQIFFFHALSLLQKKQILLSAANYIIKTLKVVQSEGKTFASLKQSRVRSISNHNQTKFAF